MATQFDQSPNNLQGVRSPVIVTLDDTNAGLAQFQYALDVYAWTGDPTTLPGSYIERLKRPPLANTVATFNVAPLLRSQFANLSRPDQFNNVTPGDEMILNLAFKAGYEASGTTDYANATSSITKIVNGYAYYADSINKNLTQSALTSREGTIYMRESGYEFIPIFWDVNSDVTGIGFESTSFDAQIYLAEYIGTKAALTDSDDFIQYVPIGNINAVEWSVNELSDALDNIYSEGLKRIYLFDELGAEIQSWNVEQVCEPKYTPGSIYFINRYGVWDWINFYKKNIKTQNVTGEQYMSARGTYSSDQLQGSLSQPEYQKYNVNGRERIRVSTGYQDDDLTTLIKELMLSETILLQVGDERPLPVNIESQSAVLQTGVNDGITNYDIEFIYAHNTISTLGT